MLISIACILVAFLWLLIETQDLSVNLCGKPTPKILLLGQGNHPAILALPASRFQPVTFEPCDIEAPEFTPKTIVNIGGKIA